MNKQQKQQEVDALKTLFANSATVVVCHYHGLTVAQIEDFRKKARASQVSVKVAKNTLIKNAANDTKFSTLGTFLKGPVALVYSKDAVLPAKIVSDFAKENEKLKIIGGSFSGEVLDESAVNALAKTPSLNESRAKLLGLLQAPATQLVSILQTPARTLASVIDQKSKQQTN